MPDPFVSAICVILNSNGTRIGTGFLVSAQLVVTCAHVLEDAATPIRVKFSGQTTPISAELKTEYWNKSKKVDVAFLVLKNALSDVTPLPLGAAGGNGVDDLFQSFGYPNLGDLDGVYARGEIIGLTQEDGNNVLQLSSGDLDQGHSGAPVWDVKRKVVVGMVASVASPGARGKFQDTAIAIPSDTIWHIYPDLRPSDRSPYLGLENFTEETSQYYFGRQALTEKLLETMRTGCRFLAVFGPSGSGKSSVVRAGLLPALKTGKLVDADKWFQVVIRPTDDPYEQLRAVGLDINNLHAFIKSKPNMERIVLFVDQFEELFTLCPDDRRIRFIHELAALLENSRFLLIISMRDDFYSAFNAKAEALAASEYLKIENIPGTLKREDLVDMIERPAESVGLALEEGLTKLIIKDVAAQGETRSAILPLLEFALEKLWEKRKDHLLTHEAYQEIGGVTGSLARWADDAYMDLPKENRHLAESLLTSLVHLGDETLALPDTRRRRSLSELTTSEAARKVIKHFTDRRLIVTSEDTVELIHDAILREWGKFGTWLNENRNFLTLRQRLAERSREWKDKKGDLLRGRELSVAQDFWAKRRQDPEEPKNLDGLEQFILQSQKQVLRSRLWLGGSIVAIMIMLSGFGIYAWGQRNNAVNAQSTTIAGMTSQAESFVNEQNARQTAQIETTKVANAEATATIIQGQVNQEILQKISENLSAQALTVIDTNYTQGLLLGVESFRLLESNNLSQSGNSLDDLPPLLNKIPDGLMQTLAFPPSETVRKILYSPNGEILATLSNDFYLWNTQDPYHVSPIQGWEGLYSEVPTDMAFNPASTLLITGYPSGKIAIWDISVPDAIKVILNLDIFPDSVPMDIEVAVSTDGNLLAVAGKGTVRLLDISQPNLPEEIGYISHPHEGAQVTNMQFDPNFKEPYLITTGEDDQFRVWNLHASLTPSGSQRAILRNSGIAEIVVSSRYVIVADTQTIDIYQGFHQGFIPIGKFGYTQYHNGPITSMVVNQDSTRLFTAGLDGAIIEWDITDLSNGMGFISYHGGHTNRVNSMAFHPVANLLASGGNDSRVAIRNVTPGMLVIQQNQIITNSEFTDVSFGYKSNLLVLGDAQGNVSLWDVSNPVSPVVTRTITIQEDPVARVGVSPDENIVVYIGENSFQLNPRGYMLNREKGTARGIFEVNTTDVFAVGNTYILAGEIGNGTLNIFRWDISKDDIRRENRPAGMDGCEYKDTSFALSNTLAAIATCNLEIWDFPEDAPPILLMQMDVAFPAGVAFNADGSLLAVANANNSISLWNLSQSGEAELIATKNNAHLQGVTSVAISADGNTLASGGDDWSIILWDITDPTEPVQRFILNGHTSPILNGGIFFTQDGKTLISTSKNEVILWDINPESWEQKACAIAGRNFTQVEWQQFLGLPIPYHATCPELPIQN